MTTTVESAVELQRRAASGAMWTLVHVIVSQPIAFVANAIVARQLGPEGYGWLASAMLTLSLVAGFASMGTVEGAVQFGAAAHARGESADAASVVQRVLGFHLAVQLPVVLVTVLLVTHGMGWPETAVALLGSAVSTWLTGATLAITVWNCTAQGAKVAMVSNLVIQGAIAVAAIRWPSAWHVWAARTAVSGLMAPAVLLALPRELRSEVLRPRRPQRFPRGFWRFALLTSVAGVVSMMVVARTELFALRWSGAIAAVGVYALAWGISQQIKGPIDALLGPLNPSIAGIVAAHPQLAPVAMLRAVRISGLLGAGVIVLALPPLHYLIPMIYGSQFADAASAFVVLGVIACSQSVVNPLLSFARARLAAGSLLRINLAGLVANLVCIVALVPVWGLSGAVAANGAGQVVLLALMSRAEIRALSVPLGGLLRCLPPFAAAVMSAGGYLLLPPHGSWSWMNPVFGVLAGVIAVCLTVRLPSMQHLRADLEPGLRLLPSWLAPGARTALDLLIPDRGRRP